jgi:hypothetical protein
MLGVSFQLDAFRLAIMVPGADAGKCGVVHALFHRLKNLVCLMLKS